MPKFKNKETFFIKEDHKVLFQLYQSWKKYDESLRIFKTRGSNIPEPLTEGIVCYLFGCKRINGKKGDATNKQNEVIEIKATSIKNDCTSFSPKDPYWDKIYFLDFYESGTKGNFKLYDLSKIDFDEVQITKQEKFKHHRKQGRRPRFSLKNLIRKKNINPKYELSLKDIEKFFQPFKPLNSDVV